MLRGFVRHSMQIIIPHSLLIKINYVTVNSSSFALLFNQQSLLSVTNEFMFKPTIYLPLSCSSSETPAFSSPSPCLSTSLLIAIDQIYGITSRRIYCHKDVLNVNIETFQKDKLNCADTD